MTLQTISCLFCYAGTTDGIYGTLNDDDARNALSLGETSTQEPAKNADIIALLTEFLKQQKSKKQ